MVTSDWEEMDYAVADRAPQGWRAGDEPSAASDEEALASWPCAGYTAAPEESMSDSTPAGAARVELDFWQSVPELLERMRSGGVLCTVVDRSGKANVLTLGWGLLGPHYHTRPILVIAVAPPRYSWRFLEETGEFVIAVPGDSGTAAADLCGTRSGRDLDKFEAAGLTKVRSAHVAAPSIRECPVNVECATYTRVSPPHLLLTPEHRRRPVEEQHTIYFAEVLGTYRYD